MGRIPKDAITQLLSSVSGLFGVYIEDMDSGEVFEMNADHVFPSASVIKVPMLALLLKDVQTGRLDWNKPIPLAAENRVGGTGILCELDPDYTPTLAVLAKLMIVVSDNTATNQIMDLIGIDRFNAFCHEMGYEHITLMRKMLDFEAIRQGKNNYMCAGEAGRLLSSIARGEFVNSEVCGTIISIMEKQQCRNKLPALLPAVPSWSPAEERHNLKPGSLLVANKTGELNRLQHDVGIFTLPDKRRYVISIFSGELLSD
ncbi:MAG TPA: serine hydrolase, partial [Clostridia bacterium]|nr:serine hydrolase [Clostridia bacterium]